MAFGPAHRQWPAERGDLAAAVKEELDAHAGLTPGALQDPAWRTTIDAVWDLHQHTGIVADFHLLDPINTHFIRQRRQRQ